jgi:hypothetical protein
MRRIVYCLLTVAALFTVVARATVDPRTGQAIAAGATGWRWSDIEATPLGCNAGNPSGNYDLQFIRYAKTPAQLTIKITSGDKEIYTWIGHANTVFAIRGDLLFYANFSPISSGGEIVSVDLTSGKERWRSPLKAMGPIQHSAYQNRINLDASTANPKGGGTLNIWGNESMGKYLEIKDADTGNTVGHRKF